MRITSRVVLLLTLALLTGCGEGKNPQPIGTGGAGEPCAGRNPLRNAYFGDLHVHTTYSFDAQIYEVRTTPPEAYRFARGEPVSLPPLDANGQGTRTLRLDRPLDFAAVTDHSEFLGEIEACTTPDSPSYDANSCQILRVGGDGATRTWAVQLAQMRSHAPRGTSAAAAVAGRSGGGLAAHSGRRGRGR